MTDERDPASHHVGYGTRYANTRLVVPCGTCKAPEGVPCTKRGGGTHTTRQDRARNHVHRATHELAMRHERAEFERLGQGAYLWAGRSSAHQCGVDGPHVLTECTPLIAADGRWVDPTTGESRLTFYYPDCPAGEHTGLCECVDPREGADYHDCGDGTCTNGRKCGATA